MDAESGDKLGFCSNLHIVTRFELPVLHMVFFHPHEGRIGVGFAVAPTIFMDLVIIDVARMA